MSAVPDRSEAARALAGALRLMRFDATGLDLFERTPNGFWRSFGLALPILPIHLWLMPLPGPADADAGLRLVLALLIYAVLWLAFPVVLLTAVDRIGRRDRYFDFVVANNWLNAPGSVLQAGLALLVQLVPVPGDVAALLSSVLYLYVLAVEWFTLKRALAVSGLVAFGLTLLDCAISQIVISAP